MSDLLATYLDPAVVADPPAPPDDRDPVVEMDRLLSGAGTPEAAEAALPEALARLAADPENETLQCGCAQIFELTRRRDGLLETWAALHERFPENRLALRMALRWLARAGRGEEGADVIARAFDHPSLTLDEQIFEADLFAEIKDHLTSDRHFQAILDLYPDAAQPRICYAKRLYQRGRVWEAGRVLASLENGDSLSPAGQALLAKVVQSLRAARTLPGGAQAGAEGGEQVMAVAMRTAIEAFSDRGGPALARLELGGTLFATGSLGAGGSERQMTHIAAALAEASRQGRPVAGRRIDGPVQLAVTNASAASGTAFFLPAVKAAGLDLAVLSDLADEPLEAGDGAEPALHRLAGLQPVLPERARFGLGRLLPLLRQTRPEAVYLWQDGMVLTGALAALAAGVPNIVASFRGLPPNLRPHLMQPEYRDTYRALAALPGVRLSANSRTAATAYADWLELPREALTVIPNAVDPLPATPTSDSEAVWRRFAARTAGACFTLGTVMRFTPNKRPLEWVDCAAATARRHPDIRFVMVGAGPELGAATRRIREHGIGERFLLTGNVPDVGFWLSRFDAFLLLSEFEGLPNVLIEAQLAGVPVISTPAGGALETFEDGIAGLALPRADIIHTGEVGARLSLLIARSDLRRRMGIAARAAARARFATPVILDRTVRLLKGLPQPDGADRVVDAPLRVFPPRGDGRPPPTPRRPMLLPRAGTRETA